MRQDQWKVEIDSTTAADWSNMLDQFSDASIYQTMSYGAIRWGVGSLSHLVLRRNGQVTAMAQLRIVQPKHVPWGMAYLRWGPILERRGEPPEAEVIAKMAEALEEEYVHRRGLLLLVIPNAFDGSEKARLLKAAFSHFQYGDTLWRDRYETFLLDLKPELSTLRAGLDKKWRNRLSRAERMQLRIISGTNLVYYDMFCALYGQMRNRKTFESVDIQEFRSIQMELPVSQKMMVFVAEAAGTPVSAVVVSAIGETATYLLGATGDLGLHSQGAYILQWSVIQWLKAHGVKLYDLGGVNRLRNPGGYHFKEGLSGEMVTLVRPLMATGSMMSSVLATGAMVVRTVKRSVVTSLNRFIYS